MHRREETPTNGRVRVERGIYRQPNGRYAVCFMAHGRPHFRAVDGDIDAARRQRALLMAAAQAGIVPASPRLLFTTVASWWLARFEARVAVGERRERTLEAHRYYLCISCRRWIAARCATFPSKTWLG